LGSEDELILPARKPASPVGVSVRRVGTGGRFPNAAVTFLSERSCTCRDTCESGPGKVHPWIPGLLRSLHLPGSFEASTASWLRDGLLRQGPSWWTRDSVRPGLIAGSGVAAWSKWPAASIPTAGMSKTGKRPGGQLWRLSVLVQSWRGGAPAKPGRWSENTTRCRYGWRSLAEAEAQGSSAGPHRHLAEPGSRW